MEQQTTHHHPMGVSERRGEKRNLQAEDEDCGTKGSQVMEGKPCKLMKSEKRTGPHGSRRNQRLPCNLATSPADDCVLLSPPECHNKNAAKQAAAPNPTAKTKRIRTIFTQEQLETLEQEFERQQYMVGPERQDLAASLSLTEAQVKVWFQNRRIKYRKQCEKMTKITLASMNHRQEEKERTSSPLTLPSGAYSANFSSPISADPNDSPTSSHLSFFSG